MRLRARTAAVLLVAAVLTLMVLIAWTPVPAANDDDAGPPQPGWRPSEDPAPPPAATQPPSTTQTPQRNSSTQTASMGLLRRTTPSLLSVAVVITGPCTAIYDASSLQMTLGSLRHLAVPDTHHVPVHIVIPQDTGADACSEFASEWDWPFGDKHVSRVR